MCVENLVEVIYCTVSQIVMLIRYIQICVVYTNILNLAVIVLIFENIFGGMYSLCLVVDWSVRQLHSAEMQSSIPAQ